MIRHPNKPRIVVTIVLSSIRNHKIPTAVKRSAGTPSGCHSIDCFSSPAAAQTSERPNPQVGQFRPESAFNGHFSINNAATSSAPASLASVILTATTQQTKPNASSNLYLSPQSFLPAVATWMTTIRNLFPRTMPNYTSVVSLFEFSIGISDPA